MKRTRIVLRVVAAALLVLGLAYWFATGGVPPRDERPGWLAEAPIAHRGLHSKVPPAGGVPENSSAAFERAVKAEVPIELDVRLTKDATVVVFHDDTLERIIGDKRRVDEVSLEEMKRLPLGKMTRLGAADPLVPTLHEALDTIAGEVPVFIEIKNPGDVGPLEQGVLDEVNRYTGLVAVMSFNPYSLAYFEERAPEIPRGQLSGTFEGEDLSWWKKLVLGQLLMNWKSRPSFVGYELDRLPSAKTTLQRWRGRRLLSWTAETPAEFERGEQVSDAVIFGPGARP